MACALLCGWTLLAPPPVVSSIYVRTQDLNHDGRPDVWRYYDAHGHLIWSTRDTNFDGVPDRIDYYHDDRLVRREVDRNFDGRIDTVEVFNRRGRLTRSVADVNGDGVADLLVLFHDGRPVWTQWRDSGRRPAPVLAAGRSTGRLAELAPGLLPLVNPFRSNEVIRGGGHPVPFYAAVVAGFVGRYAHPPIRAESTVLDVAAGPCPCRPLPAWDVLPCLRGPPA